MFQRIRNRAQEQKGFTLIELLVVILIIGILAAIAIPTFLNQRGKAYDAAAKTQVKDAQLAMETYATDHNGSYAGVTLASLQTIDPSLNDTSSATLTDPNSDAADQTATGYKLTSTAKGPGDTFTITVTNGSVARTCTGTGGGCPNPASW